MLKDRKTGCSISPIFIRHQGIPMKDKHFEYSQLREIFPAVGTKEPKPKTWLCRKGPFCCPQTDFIFFFFLTAFLYTHTERTCLNSFASNRSRETIGPSTQSPVSSGPLFIPSCPGELHYSLPPTAAITSPAHLLPHSTEDQRGKNVW